MRSSYLDYAMSVIVSRALPDVRDGLKPVHRRILFAMKEGGYDHSKPFRKSARIVGDVMGKFHPHGDTAIYDAMVRMAQLFSMRLPLVDGQGNFGSMDGDRAAAMRYTEARMALTAHALLEDIDKDTVDFRDNYDNSVQEPTVLPAQFPNLLVNGASGIAVGMATNIPPHNLGEVIDACCAYIENPDATVTDLAQFVKGPDFPTGGIILGQAGIQSALLTGRGSVIIRARARIEEIRKGREAIIVDEIPYQVNKSRLMERIAEVARDKQVEGISDLRDESDRNGVRMVIEIKRDAQADVVLNQLYRYTPLQTSFGVNMLALNGGRPEMFNLRKAIGAFIDFREEVITRRTIFELNKARDRAHVLIGLAIAVANLDDMIALIRQSKDPSVARAGLVAKAWPVHDIGPLIELIDEPGSVISDERTYQLSEEQAKAILELRLHRLTGLERDKIDDELRNVVKHISGYLEILVSRDILMGILRDELLAIRDSFANDRRTSIEESEFELDDESLIQAEDMVVTVSHGGYVKRVPLSTYRAQKRGGKGRAGMATRDEDFVNQVFVVNTHTPVLFFSSKGMVYTLKVYRLPLGTPQARGKALVNLLPLDEDETISTLMPMPEDEETWGNLNVMFATTSGTVRRNLLSDFTNIKSNGKIAMKLKGEDRLVGVYTCQEEDNILLSTKGGKCTRFPVTDIRVFSGRDSVGVRGIKLAKADEVISMTILHHADFDMEERDAYLRYASALRRNDEDTEGGASDVSSEPCSLSDERLAELATREEFILTVTDKGYGKRSSAYGYRVMKRGGQGIANMDLTERNGSAIVAAFPVGEKDNIMLVTDGGKLIRCPVHDIRIASRKTQGVTLFKVAKDERVVSVAWLAEDEEGDEEIEGEGAGADAGAGEESAENAPEDSEDDDV
jgi:DNA gyrase subunit A